MSHAYAGSKYDKNIERAAINIAVKKLGSIRGTHEIHEPFYLHPPIEARSAANGMLEPAPDKNGLWVGPASLQGN